MNERIEALEKKIEALEVEVQELRKKLNQGLTWGQPCGIETPEGAWNKQGRMPTNQIIRVKAQSILMEALDALGQSVKRTPAHPDEITAFVTAVQALHGMLPNCLDHKQS